MKKDTSRYHAVLFGCLLLIFLSVTGCSIAKSDATDSGSEAEAEQTQSLRGIVVENDQEQKQLLIQDMDQSIVSTLTYGSSSVITDKYEEQISGESVSLGMILDISYQIRDAKIVTAEVPEDAWEYQDVSKFSFSSDESMMKVAGERYKYTDTTFFSSGEKEISQMEYSDQDVLTVRGIGIYVYSVVRTSGHGYIRLKNYDDFVGGMAVVSNKIIVQITENMLITAAEGTYRLSLTKKGMTATKTVNVENDKEVEVDFSDYVATTTNIGEITFNIVPDGADLTISGTSVDYTKPITLNYGKYNITVSLTGYETYSGVLNVQEPSKTITIDLVEEVAETEDDESATATPSATESSESDDDTVTKQIDSDHTITVSAPVGVEVYLDNVYKGLTPCTFTKIIGSQTITLSDDGYVTKSYSVDILDDDKDVTLSFDDLVESSATATPSATTSSD
ncbi:MAG: PEGA domain-containing protein [Clostridiaceae bacterium]|nr:PEGA domain-containing protein [Clostridiaceae bacterium]